MLIHLMFSRKKVEENQLNFIPFFDVNKKNIEISPQAQDLLRGMLAQNENDRFDWNQVFNHPWMTTTTSTTSSTKLNHELNNSSK